ncbi:MAG: ABC transporter substrate-binding protein [Pseudomonadaceae bacterium]|nr:ABC transporter substrate-binding protein [Pseudomonadaceae bacterium]
MAYSSFEQLKRATRSLIASLLAILALGCEQAPEPAKVLHIGVLVDASGPTSSQGVAGRNGMQLAVEQANASAAANAAKVELHFQDDAFNADTAKHAVQQLLNDQVVAILGPMTSMIAVQVLPQINQTNVVLMGGSVLTPLLAGRDDQFFRTVSHHNPDAQQIADYLQQRLGVQHVNVIIELSNSQFTQPWLNDFANHYRATGASIEQNLSFTRNAQTNYASLAKQALLNQPQAVVLICGALDAAMLATQLRKLRPELPLAASSGAAVDALLEMGGRAVEGLVSAQGYKADDQSPAFLAFRSAYEARFKAPIDSAAVIGFNAANVLLQALRERQPQESVKQALLRLRTFQGLQQTISFDDSGDADGPAFLKVIQQGRFVNAN